MGEGLVQIYYSNTWNWVCADHWDKQEADVVCRMMGFHGSLSVTWSGVGQGQRNDQIWMKSLQCTGNEDSLFSCFHDGLNLDKCFKKRRVSVKCNDFKGKLSILMIFSLSIFMHVITVMLAGEKSGSCRNGVPSREQN